MQRGCRFWLIGQSSTTLCLQVAELELYIITYKLSRPGPEWKDEFLDYLNEEINYAQQGEIILV